MSLLDALLLEPYRDPREVWIAVRTDGQRGSGTVDDPYDGSLTEGPHVSISSLTRLQGAGGLYNIARVTTAQTHGLVLGDRVTIAGVGGSPACGEEPEWIRWNGNFLVVSTAGDYVFHAQFPPPHEWPEADAGLRGTAVCYRCHARFDEVMEALPPYAVVHLGPGVFPTLGYSPVNVPGGWRAKAGQKIRGSGMDITVLQLVHTVVPAQLYHGLGNDAYVEYFEVSDLTLDCNLPGQPVPLSSAEDPGAEAQPPWAPVACGAVLAPGSHVRLRRVRTIRWGTQTIQRECFVIACGGAHWAQPEQPADLAIEDCIMEQPSTNNVRECSCILVGATTPAQNRGFALRECRVDSRFVNGPSHHAVAIKGLSRHGAVWQLETYTPHGREQNSHNITLTNVQIWSPALQPPAYKVSEVLNGTFPVESVLDSCTLEFRVWKDLDGVITPEHPLGLGNAVVNHTGFGALTGGGTGGVVEGAAVYGESAGVYKDTGVSLDLIVRSNYFSGVRVGIFQFLGASATAQRGAALIAEDDRARFTAVWPHKMVPGQAVLISGALVQGSPDNPFNGRVEIESVPANPGNDSPNGPRGPTSFVYRLKQVPAANPAGDITFSARAQTHRLILENNIIETVPSVPNNLAPSGGITLSDPQGAKSAPFTFPQAILRRNVVRTLKDGPDRGSAVLVQSVGGGLVQDNLVDSRLGGDTFPPRPMQHNWSHLDYFENQGLAGESYQGYDNDTQRWEDDLGTRLEDALLASFL
jgi:hypothetical protein